MTAPARDASNEWLYGPLPDLFLGCGLLFVVVSCVFLVGGAGLFESVALAVPGLLIAVVSAPHYGATLVRVYERRSDRRAYFLFSVVATVGLLAVAGIALFQPIVGSVLATIYLSWSSWHYTAQNYGISAMFLRRRDIELDDTTRRLLRSSFVLSFVLVLLVIHEASSSVADPWVEVRLIPLAIPRALNDWLLPLCVAAYLGTTLAWVGLLGRRTGRLAHLVPTLLISLVQALWWSIPYLGNHYGLGSDWVAIDWDDRSHFFPWIACAHAAQYLWITSFYARASSGWHGQGRYYLNVLAAGSAVWMLPALIFAPGAGEFDWNFALLLAATVNIHHFILDGVIWKLRHMKIARVLIASEAAEEDEGAGRPWLRRVVWSVAALGVGLSLHGLAERFFVEPAARERGDLAAVAASLDRQAWLGVGSAFERFKLGRAFEEAGEPAAAAAQFALSAGMEPRVESIKRLIAHAYRAGDRAGFVRACDQLFELDHIERPMPTVDLGLVRRPEFIRFREACLDVSNAARPLPPSQDLGTGGGGLDGRVAPREAY